MKVLKNAVLIEKTMIKKKSRIILSDKSEDDEKYDITYKILKLGPDVDADIKVGDIPVFHDYSQLMAAKVIERTKNKIVGTLIVFQDDIIAIDE